MKKAVQYTTLFIFTILVCFPTITNAETLKDYKNKVAELKKKNNENNRLTAEASAQIDAKRNAITAANNTISSNETKVEDSKTLVAESKEKIKIRQEELSEIIETLQYTTIDSKEIYVDYIFAAETVTELMERQEIVKQISVYIQEQLDSLNNLITENQQLQVKLEDDNVRLTNSIAEYEKQVEELDALIDKYASIGLDYASQIEAQESYIKILQEAGCKDNDDIDICFNSGSSANFARPLNKGKVTQAWNATHGGIDLGGNTPGTNVYATANGTIVYTKYHYSCGGNIVYLQTNVGGQKYTVEFAHLKSINVSIGQTVNKGSIIGTLGGDPSTWYYDKCTSGTHLHYAISYGYYFSNASWNAFSTFKKNTNATAKQDISNLKSTRGWSWTSRN